MKIGIIGLSRMGGGIARYEAALGYASGFWRAQPAHRATRQSMNTGANPPPGVLKFVVWP